MAHFCGFIKLIFLLLMLERIPSNQSRPLKRNSQANSDLIAGNEFLKLFMEHDHLDKDVKSSELNSGVSAGGLMAVGKRKGVPLATRKEDSFDKESAEAGRRTSSARSLKDKGSKLNQAEGQMEDSKQVVKLVTSGSKIVFLEDYDENDAILDAEARDIDLKKNIFKQKNQSNLDDYKVVAVSVSSSSQRGSTTARNRFANTPASNKYEKRQPKTTVKPYLTMTTKTSTTATTTVRAQASTSSAKIENTAGDNFINRSHKSEFSIEEVEPLTMAQHQSRKMHSRHRTFPLTSVSDTLEALDSENSASTNIHNVLAAPLLPSASSRSTSMVTTTYHSGQRNMTINHDSSSRMSQTRHKSAATNTDEDHSTAEDFQQQEEEHHLTSSDSVGAAEDQLLPFQTVIYHDTKAGHGPQSRSISYSSISQNVEDLKKWQQSGILAEARRNVSESLKPMPRSNSSLSSNLQETAKFFSQPSKMYSEPSKFYSEPAKVYSEPAKVYGEPEKFYSEPAKVYGQPSKFYSEPAKVYSQPAKVYSEPAKTYWPISTVTTTSTQNPNTITPPAIPSPITSTPATPLPVNIIQSSRKPAIVSRIAFGEAHLISSTTSTTTSTTTTISPLTTTSRTYGSHGQHQYSRTYSNHRNPSSSTSHNNENSSLSSSSASSSSSTPSRRILFNLDRLPYDLLNAPEPSTQQQQLLELQKTRRPQQTSTYQAQQQQHQQQQQKQRHHINPCLESAVSSLFSSSTLSAHPALLKQRQQHSSLSDQQQHSNQNAKGLPTGDLVKCVAQISHTSTADATSGDDSGSGVETFTTERSHMEELFTPTPEQNYEIEESVSVMTNGRAQNIGGIPSGGGGVRNSFAQPTASPVQSQNHHAFKPNRQRTRIHFGTNVNNPTEVQDVGHRQHHHYDTNSNANADSNNNNNNHHRHHTSPDYQQYDDANPNDNDDGDNDSANGGGADKNNDYDDDGSPSNGSSGNADDDDSKVAYIVEGQNYRKYRVEEETDDGFIVGEYGVVDHNDGNLRGVRYTADSTINRSLIQKALLTFLKLK